MNPSSGSNRRTRWGRTAARLWPLAAALMALNATVAVLLIQYFERSQGPLVYALDDAYIHMAMARNIAQEGIHGVSRHAFSASSSSPLWTLLLALFFALMGVRDWIPMALNASFASLALALCHRHLARKGCSPWKNLVVLLALVFLSPLAPMVVTGMEHSLHILLSIALALRVLRHLEGDVGWRGLIALVALNATVRYEGLFLVAAVCAVLVLRGRMRLSLALAVSALTPILLYGLYMTSQGWFFLPASVLLKGAMGSGAESLQGWIAILASALKQALKRVLENGHIYASLLALAAAYWIGSRRRRRVPRGSWEPEQMLIAIVFAAFLLHLYLAQVGWFYRYESYLIALSVAAVGLSAVRTKADADQDAAHDSGSRQAQALVAALTASALLAAPLARRGLSALRQAPVAMTNIYHQQIQTARLLGNSYSGRSVAVNDLGAVSYLTDLEVVDIVGLGTLEVASLRLGGDYRRERLQELVRRRGVIAAAVYEGWLPGGPPDGWIKVGAWTIPENVVCASDTVVFFASGAEEAQELRRRLLGHRLPKGVESELF